MIWINRVLICKRRQKGIARTRVFPLSSPPPPPLFPGSPFCRAAPSHCWPPPWRCCPCRSGRVPPGHRTPAWSTRPRLSSLKSGRVGWERWVICNDHVSHKAFASLSSILSLLQGLEVLLRNLISLLCILCCVLHSSLTIEWSNSNKGPTWLRFYTLVDYLSMVLKNNEPAYFPAVPDPLATDQLDGGISGSKGAILVSSTWTGDTCTISRMVDLKPQSQMSLRVETGCLWAKNGRTCTGNTGGQHKSRSWIIRWTHKGKF